MRIRFTRAASLLRRRLTAPPSSVSPRYLAPPGNALATPASSAKTAVEMAMERAIINVVFGRSRPGHASHEGTTDRVRWRRGVLADQRGDTRRRAGARRDRACRAVRRGARARGQRGLLPRPPAA